MSILNPELEDYCYNKSLNFFGTPEEAALSFGQYYYLTPLRAVDRGGIYHYTDKERFKQILEVGFGLTEFSEMEGDPKEGKLIVCLWKRACKELLNDEKIGTLFYKEMMSITPDNTHNLIIENINGAPDHKLNTECEVFIGCFSKNGNNCRMWNMYCGKDCKKGINFCIVPGKIDTANEPFKISLKDRPLIRLIRVIYDKNLLIDFLKAELIFLSKTYDKYPKWVHTNAKSLLNNMRFSYKRKKYSWEDEVRIVFTLPTEKYDGSIKIKIVDGKRRALLPLNEKYYFHPLKSGPQMTSKEETEYLNSVQSSIQNKFNLKWH